MNMMRSTLVVVTLMVLSWQTIGLCDTPCLNYEPKESLIFGVINAQAFPGPPEYSDITKEDKSETFWILHLDNPICVEQTNKEDEVNISESNVTSMQLIMPEYDKYRSLLGKNVIVKGKLTHQITIHHRTTVLIIVTDIKERPNQALQTDAAEPRR